jgi:hypothetical protein
VNIDDVLSKNNELGTLKPVEVTIRRQVERRIMERMN